MCPSGAGPPSIDVVRKTRSPQTIGDEWPRPGTGVFHAMFLPGDHSSGYDASGEMPRPSGPRHCAQLSPLAGVRIGADESGSVNAESERERRGHDEVHGEKNSA